MPHYIPLKVLIADDHFLTRQTVSDVMRAHKVGHFEAVADGSEAREKITQAMAFGTPYDVVFLDWNMPLIQGIDVLKHFRNQENFSRTAFVMLTAESNQSQVLEAIHAGATAYIIKPVAGEMISKKFFEVLEWLKKKKAEGNKTR
jgi:two-component system chemotaxis response regulator CheY